MTFQEALRRWEKSERESVAARLDYERVYAEALVKATGGSAEVRKAQAQLAALEAQKKSEDSAITAKSHEQMVEYLKLHGAAA